MSAGLASLSRQGSVTSRSSLLHPLLEDGWSREPKGEEGLAPPQAIAALCHKDPLASSKGEGYSNRQGYHQLWGRWAPPRPLTVVLKAINKLKPPLPSALTPPPPRPLNHTGEAEQKAKQRGIGWCLNL